MESLKILFGAFLSWIDSEEKVFLPLQNPPFIEWIKFKQECLKRKSLNKPGHALTDLECNKLISICCRKYREQRQIVINRFSFFLCFSPLGKSKDRTYTLMMIDPDYPHHSNGQFYLHWLVTNIPVSIFCKIFIATNSIQVFKSHLKSIGRMVTARNYLRYWWVYTRYLIFSVSDYFTLFSHL